MIAVLICAVLAVFGIAWIAVEIRRLPDDLWDDELDGPRS